MAKKKEIVVLHEYGAPTHYEGLRYYCEANNITIVFREFTWLKPLVKSIFQLDSKRLVHNLINIGFLVKLLISTNRHVVLGIAPYDYRMIFFSMLAKNHNIYYHTSWPTWDGSNYPKKVKFNRFRDFVVSRWKLFLERRCASIFCVSTHTMRELQRNYTISCPIGVVYHSVHPNFAPKPSLSVDKPLKLLFIGRVIEKKGIKEIIELLRIYGDQIEIGIVGEGDLDDVVLLAVSKYSNLVHYGKVDRSNLYSICQQYDVLLCPSRKGYGAWEELFGMAIIEGMICGLIPVATDHNGPREIIDDGINGYILKDESLFEDLVQVIGKLLHNTEAENLRLKSEAIQRGKMFLQSNIAVRWQSILNFNSVKTA